MAPDIAATEGAAAPLVTREQVEEWHGAAVSDDVWDRLVECVGWSSVPDAVRTIIDSLIREDENDRL